ncbi:hypothetical protein T265_00363 [Opisthorchis viverrini]|uniref:Uncharacterized protein n=1 Tax=Opisthorchis viverrini TaxID=6198 RepID=A0A075A2I1_OPIVI|nr:hypothetical protein T265_00363 [Opisthorchis viverrini]KER33928.1 hypothetical protein T265_00363 [Opisthorchis viverrini]
MRFSSSKRFTATLSEKTDMCQSEAMQRPLESRSKNSGVRGPVDFFMATSTSSQSSQHVNMSMNSFRVFVPSLHVYDPPRPLECLIVALTGIDMAESQKKE